MAQGPEGRSRLVEFGKNFGLALLGGVLAVLFFGAILVSTASVQVAMWGSLAVVVTGGLLLLTRRSRSS